MLETCSPSGRIQIAAEQSSRGETAAALGRRGFPPGLLDDRTRGHPVGALKIVACTAPFGILPRGVLDVVLWALFYLFLVQLDLPVAVRTPNVA
jgi:hypothetical protein